MFGFALAGGGTNWGLAQGAGHRTQRCLPGRRLRRHHAGPAYVAGALAFANNWFTTNRSALGDQFSATSMDRAMVAAWRRLSLRRAVADGHAALRRMRRLQTQWFHTPTYSETDLSGGGFGLSYNAMTATTCAANSAHASTI